MSKTKKPVIIIVILSILLMSSLLFSMKLLSEPKPFYNIVLGAEELNEGIKDEKAILIDLRDEADYEAGHIENAINMPFTDNGIKMLDYLTKRADKDSRVFLMCYHGNRSGQAFNLLRDKGYTNLNYVKFGYEDYVNAMGSGFKPALGECPCKNYD